MSDLKQKIDEALAALRAAHPRARERILRFEDLDTSWSEAAAALALATGRDVTTQADGGAVPNSYKYRADADHVRVIAHPDGTSTVTATRARARHLSYGDSGGWQDMWIEGGADLADQIKPHLPPHATLRLNGSLRIDATAADIRRIAAILSPRPYAEAASEMLENANRRREMDRALGVGLSW